MRAGVARGELQIGTWVNMARNPAILSLLKAAGLDFARVDMEHSSPSMETIADMALLARAIDFPIAVRPPKANREWITRLLDAGVWNLHCPQVESTAHAAEIVEDAFLRVFAHGARVEQDHVGILGPVRARESFGRVQHVGHLVRVVLVHLAAERADEKLFRHGLVCHCAAPGREGNPWESSW